jgi:cullin-associated NEDD8-dissociated protein 1
MGLSDLMKEIKLDPQAFLGDESIEFKVLGQVLQLVEDKISEVKNQAVKWYAILLLLFLHLLNSGWSLGQLIKIIREPQMELVVDKLTEFSTSTDEELRDISGLGKAHF